jgi:hypothetical protein
MLFRLSPPLREGLGALACAFGLFNAAYAAGLNDTGITFCGDANTNTASCAMIGSDSGAYPRQDATQGRDAIAMAGKLVKVGGGSAGFDFTKIANDGGDLTVSAAVGNGPTEWACTRDNVTGLTWEVKTTSGLRSMSHSYTWYNSDPSSNGGSAGTASGGTCYQPGRCDTEKFVQDVNAAGLCGTKPNAWRMPTVKELQGIADYGQTGQAIDLTYFPNIYYFANWAGSPYSVTSIHAWYVEYLNGTVDVSYRDYFAGIRLVRSGP